jgi:hypothetical protein
MREIKFKVYSLIDKKFLENLHFIDNDWDLCFSDFWWKAIRYENQDNYKVLFSTWLKDKKWIDIFESDIVKGSWNYIWEVIYDNDFLQYRFKNWREFDYYWLKKLEIIWNIYENKDLLPK